MLVRMIVKKMNNKWICLGCKVDTKFISEHYFVNNDIWLPAVGSNKGMLCIGCLEMRIERKLTPKDFTKVHINNPKLYNMSARLLNRLKG